MSVYKRLLLSSGGGIISAPQQAAQTPNTATLLIGLGGTGVECIRTIKTQVYARLRPDNPTDVVPAYSHIRFLGVDTTEGSKGDAAAQNPADRQNRADLLAALDDSEFFSIADRMVRQTFTTSRSALAMKREISWLEYDKIEAPNLADAGAGGIRQVGRYMLMNKSQAFLAKLRSEIDAARNGLVNPRLNIHIFTGLSGGTGSGCFLDVCYMVRSIVQNMGGTIFGYCFMPDVNLSRIPEQNTDTRSYIPKNGYAAMQELDYCMGLQRNGGSFAQEYQNHNIIQWNTAPVDMCHLICSTDVDGNYLSNGYEYAMNVTAEYLMDFLTASDAHFDLTQHLANFRAMISQADAKKDFGAEMAYCVIGASCASIPLREINTYLASELFDRFSKIRQNMPSSADVEKLAFDAFAPQARSIKELYDVLLDQLRGGADNNYEPYPDDWQLVRDQGNGDMVLHYTTQTSEKLRSVETNAASMVSEENGGSLLNKLREQLTKILRDIQRGPVFAYGLLSASTKNNLLNLIDGLLDENQNQMNEEAEQSKLRKDNYEDAKADFDNNITKMFSNKERLFREYKDCLWELECHKLAMGAYQRLNEVLITFRKQVEAARSGYYGRLQAVMINLIETFAENKNALEDEKILRPGNSFEVPMMTISELKPSLDLEIQKLNISNMMDAFMGELIAHESDWLMSGTQGERKISRLVTNFFVNNAFKGFADRSITSFLKDKYESLEGSAISDEQLSVKIYNDWIVPLTGKASPRFHFNPGIWSSDKTSKLAFLSYPDISAPIQSAAAKMNQKDKLWGLKQSKLTDRIYVMCSACGLPLCAYNYCREYEKNYYSAMSPGRHYYEGKPIPGMEFNDWNQLASVTPQSIIDLDWITEEDLRSAVIKSRRLYDEARASGIIDDDSFLCEPDPASVAELEESCARCEALLEGLKNAFGIPELQKALDLLDISKLRTVRTQFALPNDGNRVDLETIEKIREDHFVSSPAIHASVRRSITRIETLQKRVDAIKNRAKSAIDGIQASAADIQDYCDAVFVGVIALEGFNVIYHQETGIMKDDIVLSQRSRDFPFGMIPLYQGYVSFQALSPERKAEIRQKVSDLYVANDPVINETGEKLRGGELSEQRIQAMAQLAQRLPEKEDIHQFLEELRQQFQSFLLQIGL